MKAIDVMVRDVVTVGPETSIKDAVELLVHNDISALPVVDADDHLIGVISEADLIRRDEIDTEKRRPWWLEAVMPGSTLAEEFAKSHGMKVGELMTTDVVSASPDTSLEEIATLLERNRIKRVPIVDDGQLVGVVSRVNLVQALASKMATSSNGHHESDREIRTEVLARLGEQRWTDFGSRNVTVTGGIVHMWGLVGSPEERRALVALAESVPGVTEVSDEMIAAY